MERTAQTNCRGILELIGAPVAKVPHGLRALRTLLTENQNPGAPSRIDRPVMIAAATRRPHLAGPPSRSHAEIPAGLALVAAKSYKLSWSSRTR